MHVLLGTDGSGGDIDDNASQDLACGRLSDDDDDDDEDRDDADDDEDEEEEGEGEFTRGASLLAALDNQAVELEAKAQELLELYRANCGGVGEGEEHEDDPDKDEGDDDAAAAAIAEAQGDSSILEERDVMVRRALRIRCYLGHTCFFCIHAFHQHLSTHYINTLL